VISAVFKAVAPSARVAGGFDSHALPPFLCKGLQERSTSEHNRDKAAQSGAELQAGLVLTVARLRILKRFRNILPTQTPSRKLHGACTRLFLIFHRKSRNRSGENQKVVISGLQ
jgi:hypothetical protein